MAQTALDHDQLIACITRALVAGLPFLAIGLGDDEIRLAYRTAGTEIDDPSCTDIFEATQTGIFQRFERLTGDTTSFIYIRIGDLAHLPQSIDAILKMFPSTMLATVPMQVAFQVVRHQAAMDAARRRTNTRAASGERLLMTSRQT